MDITELVKHLDSLSLFLGWLLPTPYKWVGVLLGKVFGKGNAGPQPDGK